MTKTVTTTKSFIEVQFPVSKVSKESYKERKSNYSQTLTGIGKWWGRKPLVLVRAALLGLLMPSSEDPSTDRDVFLKVLTMDDDGLWHRKTKNIPIASLCDYLPESERPTWFEQGESGKPKLLKGLKAKDKQALERSVFMQLPYDEKIKFCERPENITGPSEDAWVDINKHLGTSATCLPELFQQLGQKEFGHVPKVGDAFSGGGSIPFEAARLGCEVHASDLNPVAALLTWASLYITGGSPALSKAIASAKAKVYEEIERTILEWGIETNESGDRADAFLYCSETWCPECGWLVPLAPSWVIGEKTRCVALLEPKEEEKRFELRIESGVSSSVVATAKAAGTVKDSYLICPNQSCKQRTPIVMLRGDRRSAAGTEFGLRLWENSDLIPRPEDVFQERLYCVRWVSTSNPDGKSVKEYRAPSHADLDREEKVLQLLRERFTLWQEQGYIPSRLIEPGDKTDEPIRTRGWTHWHHLFNPRQLLLHGLISDVSDRILEGRFERIAMMLWVGILANRDSKAARWVPSYGVETTAEVFSTQALNTLYNWASRGFTGYQSVFSPDSVGPIPETNNIVEPADCRELSAICDIWITDPPYADAINYHELSEFFLSWYEKRLKEFFPGWYMDSKRALAVKGADDSFRNTMVSCYRRLSACMTPNGMQVVMFTHQNAAVWADLALILWASGLRVSAAWCIATETSSSLKEGNYVQGTVLLVLRKQDSNVTAFLDELYPQVEAEVTSQLEQMLQIEDLQDPNFGDTDYQLAAYAAALRVLTQYKTIEDIDVAYELGKSRRKGEESPVERIIADAVRVACDYLLPKGFDSFIWKTLTPDERFYLKGLDLETGGEFRAGAYQELARGFGIKDYKPLLSSGQANHTRVKTASEFGNKLLGDGPFGDSLVRHCLFAVRETVRTGEVKSGKNWLRTEVPEYWTRRKAIIELLEYFSRLALNNKQWSSDSQNAKLLAGAIQNDHA